MGLKETAPPTPHTHISHTPTPGRIEQQGLVPTCPTVEPEALSPPLEVISPSQDPGFAVFAFVSFQAPLEHFSLQTGSGNCWNRTESSLANKDCIRPDPTADWVYVSGDPPRTGSYVRPVSRQTGSYVTLGPTSNQFSRQSGSHVR